MNFDDRIEQLYHAAELLEEVIELVDGALSGTNEYNKANAYILPHLKDWHDNPRSGNMGIIQYAESLEEERDYLDSLA